MVTSNRFTSNVTRAYSAPYAAGASRAQLRRWAALCMASIVTVAQGPGHGAIAREALSPIVVSTDHQGFVDSRTSQPFVVRGVNYFHLNKSGPYDNFDTFDPTYYRSDVTARDLDEIKKSGYNVVRTFLNGYLPDRGFDESTPDLPKQYVANVVDFLSRAAERGIRVVITSSFNGGQDVPSNFLSGTAPTDVTMVAPGNRLLLDRRYATAMASFYEQLLRDAADLNPVALSAIFSIDLYNELHFDIATPPFACLCGQYVLDGRTYNLADYKERQALLDQATSRWVAIVRTGVRAAAPNVLTTISIFPNTTFGHDGFDGGRLPKSAGTASPYPLRPRALIHGGVDYIDVHLYVYPAKNERYPPAMHDDLERIALSLELDQRPRNLPLVIGELGAYRAVYATPDAAVPELLSTLKSSCRLGAVGWIFWMWNGPGDTWTAKDDGGRIDQALAPISFRQPCSSQ